MILIRLMIYITKLTDRTMIYHIFRGIRMMQGLLWIREIKNNENFRRNQETSRNGNAEDQESTACKSPLTFKLSIKKGANESP